LLKKVLNSAPGRHDLRLTLGELMLMNDEPIAARVILTPLKNVTDDDTIRRQAQILLDNIQANIENQQAIQEYKERRRLAEAAAAVHDSSVDDKTPDRPPTITRSPSAASSPNDIIETA